MKRIAVVLCGSGFKDGSEIRESVAVLWALSSQAVNVECFAPDEPQKDVMNCLTSSPMIGESRNMLVEAARIARGEIQPLKKLVPSEFDALIIPGGFGVAKNLCSFATQGSKGSVHTHLREILVSLYDNHKPIGAVCISPAVLALAFPNHHFELTMGPKSEASDEIQKLGHRHIETKTSECHVDKVHKIVTTGAYMHNNAPLHEIFSGIDSLVENVVRLTGNVTQSAE